MRSKLQSELLFLEHCMHMMRTGKTLSEVLILIEPPRHFKKLSSYLGEGMKFHESLHRCHASQRVVDLVFEAEEHAQFKEAILKGIEEQHVQHNSHRKAYNLLVYPCSIFIIFYGALLLFDVFLFDQFSVLYSGQKEAMRSIYRLELLFQWMWYTTYSVMFMCCVLLGVQFNSKLKRYALRIVIYLRSYIPLRLFKIQNTIELCFALHRAFEKGYTYKEIAHYFKLQHENHILPSYVRSTLIRLERSFQEGKTLSEFIETTHTLKTCMTICSMAENEHVLSEMLLTYGKVQQIEYDRRLGRYVKILQPCIFGSIGGLLIFVYVSLIFPMYTLVSLPS